MEQARNSLISNRYRIIEYLGKGIHGTILKGYDTLNSEVVAMKIITIYDPEEALPLSFYREVKCLMRVKSDNIIKLKRIERMNNSLCIIMECCDQNLKELMEDKQIIKNDIVIKSILIQMLRGINDLHLAGFTHRDLKPSNVLLTGGKYVKLADFGTSKPLNCGCNTAKVSTRPYIAPEMLLGSPNYDYAVDMWSFGIILTELVTGQRFPVKSDSETTLLNDLFRICGTPEDGYLSTLPNFRIVKMLRLYPRKLGEYLEENVTQSLKDAIPIICSLLSYEPDQRPTAEQLLGNPFFSYSSPSVEIPISTPFSSTDIALKQAQEPE